MNKSSKPHVMNLVVRGDKDRLVQMRKQLHILAIQKDVSLGSLVVSILLNYVAKHTTEHGEVRA